MSTTKVSPSMGGGEWKLIGTSVAATSASLTITGLDSTYDCYAIIGTDLLPASDGVTLQLQFGDSGGVDVGASDYRYHLQGQYDGATTYAATASTGATHILVGSSVGNATAEGCGFVGYLVRPGDGTINPLITGNWVCNDTAVAEIQGGMFIGTRAAVITLDRVLIQFSSGNITSGRLSVYGIAHA